MALANHQSQQFVHAMGCGEHCVRALATQVVCLWPSLQGRTHRVRVQDGSGAWCRARRPWKSTCPTAESHGTKFLDHTSEGRVPSKATINGKGRHEGGATRVRGTCVVLCVVWVVLSQALIHGAARA